MTTKNEDIILERINQLEGKIDRIEQLIMLILDEDNLTEEELQRVAQADKLVKEKAFDKLVLVK
ncbi:MAG TPA: hypothetical protein VMX55_10395 [candidate division Zixibacteria bacterium]|nr:hypothetical protein [candidate division Zixibacteria bacterium]